MDTEQQAAFDELTALLKLGGRLKIITSEHVCGGGKVPTDEGFKRSKCKAFEYDLEDPGHYYLADVTEIAVAPQSKRIYVATSARGDAVMGYPTGLLSALRKWNR